MYGVNDVAVHAAPCPPVGAVVVVGVAAAGVVGDFLARAWLVCVCVCSAVWPRAVSECACA